MPTRVAINGFGRIVAAERTVTIAVGPGKAAARSIEMSAEEV